MVTTKSSETMAEAEYLRSQRTTSQADVDKNAAEHDVHDIPAAVRWSAVAH